MDDQVINELTNLVTIHPASPQGYSYKDVVITLDQEQDSCVLMERQYQNRNKRLFYASGLAILCGMVAFLRRSTGFGTLRGASSMIAPSFRHGHREFLDMTVPVPADDLPAVLHVLGEMKATTSASEIDFIWHEMDTGTNEALCSFSVNGQDALKHMQQEIIPLFSEVDLVALLVDTSTPVVGEQQQEAPGSNTVQLWTGYLYPSQNTQDAWKDIIEVVAKACKDSPFVFPRVELLGDSAWRREKKNGALYRVGVVLQMPEKDRKWLLDQETSKVKIWWPQVAQYLVDSHMHAPE
jgi:hypothetical protein